MPPLLSSLFLLLGALQKCLSQSPPLELDPRQMYSTTDVTFNASLHDEQFFSFVTKPKAWIPRLTITTYDKSSVAPGYIFIGSYSTVEQKGVGQPWLAPFIYDSDGELIWSGSELFEGYSVENFRVSILDGEPVLTGIHPENNYGVVVDNTYTMRHTVMMNQTGHLNMHEFGLVDDGARALHLTKDIRETTRHNSLTAGYNGRCNVLFGGIREVDLLTGEPTFEWDPETNIELGESMYFQDNATSECTEQNYFDYLHANSIDKLSDGDYLLSGRCGHAIYKISAKDGSIVWRLGGKKSDFEIDGHFSGQHDVRCVFQNSTYMVISMMDNAYGGGWPVVTNDFSRGLVLGVDLENMVAKTIAHYDHPREHYATRAGSLSFLPNGNAFACWRTLGLTSEYTPDGRMIMEAEFPSGLHAYRTFRFPWVGRPAEAPAVHSQITPEGNTLVHVSWNGDTEAAQWKLYKTDARGGMSELVASTKRTSFETALTYEGNAAFVQLHAYDRNGIRLVVSPITQTIRAGGNAYDATIDAKPDITEFTASDHDIYEPVASPMPSQMLDASDDDAADTLRLWQSDDQSHTHPSSAFILPLAMLASSLLTGLAIWAIVRIRGSGLLTRRRTHSALPTDEKWSEEDTLLEEEEASTSGLGRLRGWFPPRSSSTGQGVQPKWMQQQESFDVKARRADGEGVSEGPSN